MSLLHFYDSELLGGSKYNDALGVKVPNLADISRLSYNGELPYSGYGG